MRRNSPQFAGAPARIEAAFARLEPLLGFVEASAGEQRLARGEVGLDGVCRRNARRVHELVGHRQRFVEGAAPDRQLDAQHLQRPLVPAHRLRAVGAVRLAGAAAGTRRRARTSRASGESARACRTRRRSSRGTGSGCGLRACASGSARRVRGRRAARRSARAWRARRRGRGPSRASRACATLRSASASACSWRWRISATFAWLWTIAGEHVVGLDRRGEPFALAQRGDALPRCGRTARAGCAESECTSARCRRSPAACSADAASVRWSRTMPESPTCL